MLPFKSFAIEIESGYTVRQQLKVVGTESGAIFKLEHPVAIGLSAGSQLMNL